MNCEVLLAHDTPTLRLYPLSVKISKLKTHFIEFEMMFMFHIYIYSNLS